MSKFHPQKTNENSCFGISLSYVNWLLWLVFRQYNSYKRFLRTENIFVIWNWEIPEFEHDDEKMRKLYVYFKKWESFIIGGMKDDIFCEQNISIFGVRITYSEMVYRVPLPSRPFPLCLTCSHSPHLIQTPIVTLETTLDDSVSNRHGEWPSSSINVLIWSWIMQNRTSAKAQIIMQL